MPLSRAASDLLENPDLVAEVEALRVAALRTRLLKQDQLPAVRFEEQNFNLPRLQRNLVLINQAVQRLARTDPGDDRLHDSALFVARCYEQLAELNRSDAPRLRLTAAIHYELAGYQANAATMARMAYDINVGEETRTLESQVSAFLQRRFLRCSVDGLTAQEERRTGAQVYSETIAAASLNLARRALGTVSTFFITGDPSLMEEAQADLDLARLALGEAGLSLETNLLGGVRTLVPRLQGVSIWTLLGSVHPDNALWNRYLRALGRGLGGNFALDLRSISELWPSQRYAVAAGILDGSSRVVRMPTSAGKTRIAEMVIVDSLAKRPGSRALYVAPFNALSSEVEQGFNALFTDLGLSLSALTGAFDISTMDEVAEHEDLLIVTPEKLDQLLRGSSTFLDEVDTVILDEGHIVGEEQRGPKYEMTVTRLRRRRPEAKIVALSAVVPLETLEDFSAWLKADQQAISSAWRPTIQRMARLRWRDQQGDLVFARPTNSVPEEELLFADRDSEGELTVPGVVRTEVLPYQHPETRRLRRPNFPESGHRAQVAAAYSWQVVDQGPVLVYCQKPQDASAVCKAVANRREWAELRGEAIPNALQFRRRRSAVVAEEWLGRGHEVTERLYYGIGVHHATLPEAVKNAIEDDFRDRELSLLAATGTLAQGVNLPVRTLIVHTTRRFDDDMQITVPMKARDFWNIAGRVGRAGAETEGTVVFLDFNPNDRSDFFRYLRARENVEPVESALAALLRDLVNNRISAPAVAQRLDPEMLALLVEESELAQSPEGVRQLLEGSLLSIQALRADRDPAPMWRVMAATSTVIAQRVPDLELRKVYAATGMSAQSCVGLHEHIVRHGDLLRAHFDQESSTRELLAVVLEGLSAAREMAPRYAVDVGHSELLERWMAAENVGEIAESFDLDSVHLTGFIEDFFGYRLPWGISGYLRIAQEVLAVGDMPRHLAAIPALVRYGVPSEVASWAMALGVPSRAVALHLSERYVRSAASPTSTGFRRWLSRIDPDSLGEETGLGLDGVRAATKAVLRAHGNDHLRAHYAGAGLLPITVSTRLNSDEARMRFAALGSGLPTFRCVRDYDSSFRNAVVLELEGHLMARLPRDASDAIALELDGGRQIDAVLTEAPEPGSSTLRLTLEWTTEVVHG